MPHTQTELPTPVAFNNWHPLQLIPYFSRWPASPLRNLLYTFIWNNLFGAFIAVLSLLGGRPHSMARFVWESFVITQCVGFSIHALFDACEFLIVRRLPRFSNWQRSLYFILIPLVGIYTGYLISFALLGRPDGGTRLLSGSIAAQTIIISLAMSMLLNVFFYANARKARVAMEIAAHRQRTLDAERRALEAQLRMLQAQIEPHFLYNTLANAVGLIDPAPIRAKQLLECLIDYLRASLAASREADTRLGPEIDTLCAYLDLMQIRMGDRLSYHIDVPDTLRDHPLPPMLLQPLVENAITHGLEPKVTGGEIRLSAEAEDDALFITVADTGAGLVPGLPQRPGGGVGLSNLRERLNALYEGRASISLLENTPCGVKAVLKLPFKHAVEHTQPV